MPTEPEVLRQIEGFGEVGDMLGELGMDDAFGNPIDDEGDGPGLKLFRPDDD